MSENTVTVVSNLPEIEPMLNALSKEVRRKIVRRANSIAGRIFVASTVGTAPKDTGLLKASVFYRRLTRTSNDLTQRAQVGVRYMRGKREAMGNGVIKITTWKGNTARFGSKRAGKFAGKLLDAYYARWVEEGHLLRGLNFGKAFRGGDRSKRLQRERSRASGARFIQGQRFMHRSFVASNQKALDAFYEELVKGLIRAQEEANSGRR